MRGVVLTLASDCGAEVAWSRKQIFGHILTVVQ